MAPMYGPVTVPAGTRGHLIDIQEGMWDVPRLGWGTFLKVPIIRSIYIYIPK